MSPRGKEVVFWVSVAVFYGSGALLALTIVNRAGLLPIMASAAWWFVTLCGMHAMHEVHASSPRVTASEDRFKKPDVPQR